MYVALGRDVFATPAPAKVNMVIDQIPADMRRKVPDPNEPIGCLDNPLQSASHYLFHSADFGGDGSGSGKIGIPDLLTLCSLRRTNAATENGKDEEWLGEVSQRHTADVVCGRATLREDLPNGLSACRVAPADPLNGLKEDWASSYISQIYRTPLGRSFVVNCGPGLFSGPIGDCDVAYAMTSDVGISYRFRPYQGSHPIPVDQIIAYDKSLRAAVERAQVKNYPWPD